MRNLANSRYREITHDYAFRNVQLSENPATEFIVSSYVIKSNAKHDVVCNDVSSIEETQIECLSEDAGNPFK